jgi:hypothetical protein
MLRQHSFSFIHLDSIRIKIMPVIQCSGQSKWIYRFKNFRCKSTELESSQLMHNQLKIRVSFVQVFLLVSDVILFPRSCKMLIHINLIVKIISNKYNLQIPSLRDFFRLSLIPTTFSSHMCSEMFNVKQVAYLFA